MGIQISSSPTPIASPSRQREQRAAYLRQLLSQRLDLPEDLLASGAAAAIQEIRQQAVAQVQELAMPSTRDEEWRFTDLSELLAIKFQPPPSSPTGAAIAPEQLSPWQLPEAPHRLVFIDGQYATSLSTLDGLPADLWAGNLHAALMDGAIAPKVMQYLAKQPNGNEVFTALNTAGIADAAVLMVPRNVAVTEPIHLLFLTTETETPSLVQPRVLVVAEANSEITILEEYGSLGEGVHLTNGVTELWLETNAQITHTRLQLEGEHAFHIGKTAVTQARDSRYRTQAVSLGAQLSRHNLEVFHTGEQVETVLNGLTAIAQSQVSDTHSAILYAKPHGTSRQLHKCIVGDRAHGIFNGRVLVPQAAQLTDAGQLNQNLLLSPKARMDTKPQLEIVADNVKCTHGATVGQLETDEIFYLRSRGIDEEASRRLLIYAFAYEILDMLPLNSLKQRLSDQILAKT
jgi:Fe-S cluster assembly protein SufD